MADTLPNMEDMIMANGPIKPATAADIEKDTEGITKPNLHRRLDEDLTVIQPEQVAKDKHSIFVGGTSSFRGIEHFYYSNTDIEQEITDTFIGDGKEKSFILRPFIIEITSVTINGTAQAEDKYTVDKANNMIVFKTAPAKNRTIVVDYRIISETP